MVQEIKFLSIASLIFKILAWISAIFFVIVSLIVLFGAGGDTPRAASIIFLLGGGLYFVMLFTAAAVIKLLISISYKIDKLDKLLEGKPLK